MHGIGVQVHEGHAIVGVVSERARATADERRQGCAPGFICFTSNSKCRKYMPQGRGKRRRREQPPNTAKQGRTHVAVMYIRNMVVALESAAFASFVREHPAGRPSFAALTILDIGSSSISQQESNSFYLSAQVIHQCKSTPLAPNVARLLGRTNRCFEPPALAHSCSRSWPLCREFQ